MTYGEKLRVLRDEARLMHEQYREIIVQVSEKIRHGKTPSISETKSRFRKFVLYQAAFDSYTKLLAAITKGNIPLRKEFDEVS